MATMKTLTKFTINSGLAVAGYGKGVLDASADAISDPSNKTLHMLGTRAHKVQYKASKKVGYEQTEAAISYTASGLRSVADSVMDMFDDEPTVTKPTGYGNLGKK